MITTTKKILNREDLESQANSLREAGKKIVFTNGCFDLVHVGHLRYLQAARELGDALILAINDDASLRRLKGEGRPILPCVQRKKVLAAFECVDIVTDFDEDTPHALLRLLKPDLLVKGGNYPVEGVIGREVVWDYGGEVRTIQLTPGKSTSNIVTAIKK